MNLATGMMSNLVLSVLLVAFIRAEENEVKTLMDDFWEWKVQEYPEFATMIGLTSHHMDRLNLDIFEKRKKSSEEFLRRAETLESLNLSSQELLNVKILKHHLNTYIHNMRFIKFYTPLTILEGPQFTLKKIIENFVNLNNKEDYENLLKRYDEVPIQISEMISLMQGNIKNRLMPSNWSISAVPNQIKELLQPVVESVFYQPFLSIPPKVPLEQRRKLKRRAIEKIETFLSSFKNLLKFVQEEYLPATRPIIGISSLPSGDEYYKSCLKFYADTQLTPEKIHQIGNKEVQRIEEEMLKTIKIIGLSDKSFSEVIETLRNDPDQNFRSQNQIMKMFDRTLHKSILPHMKTLFYIISPLNVSVEAIDSPSLLREAYRSSMMAGTQSGTLYFNTDNQHSPSRHDITVISLGEGIPGHLLHINYLNSESDIPEFKKHPDVSRVMDAPAKFPVDAAFNEGWRLYAQYLGEELGLYNDPYQRLGWYSTELLHSSQLVVDTGIHALGWTRDQALHFMKEHTSLQDKEIQEEINRIISLPGQACAYKIGERKIKSLRKIAENKLGASFSIRDFHDTVLRCSSSLTIVEHCVKDYIDKNLIVETNAQIKTNSCYLLVIFSLYFSRTL